MYDVEVRIGGGCETGVRWWDGEITCLEDVLVSFGGCSTPTGRTRYKVNLLYPANNVD